MNRLKRNRRWVLVLLLLLIGLGGYRVVRTDANVRKAREIRKELAAANLPPEQRREKVQELRTTMEKMKPGDRERMRREMAEERRKRFEAEMQSYAKMPRDDKDHYLDQQIDRMEQMRQRMQQTGGQGTGTGQGGSSVSSGGGNGSGFQGAQGNRGNMSPEDREKRRKQFLDDTTPEFRAARDQFFQDLRARRQQRGFSGGSGFGR